MEIIYAVVAFVIVAGTMIVVALLAERWDPVVRRLRGLMQTGGKAITEESILRWEETEDSVLPWRRVLEKVGQALLGGERAQREMRRSGIRQRLMWAGFHNPRIVLFFLGTKLILAIGLAYSYTMYGVLLHRALAQVLLVSAILGVLGFFLPDFWLSQRIKVRQREIQNALPDMLDLLVVCVEAGLGLDAAIAKMTDPDLSRNTPLEKEMRRVHLEFRAGRPRDESLRALGERTGVQAVRAIVAAFVQTEKLGTSLANTLRVHAEGARVERRHRAEKAAYLAPVKMLFPIVFFLFPAIFVVTLAPAVLKLSIMFRGLR